MGKSCWSKCGVQSFLFSDQFDFDNHYWRDNFFNFIDPSQDSTLLINENKFELLTMTQKRQLKYYIKFWDKFIEIRKERKKKRDLDIENNKNEKNNNDEIVESEMEDTENNKNDGDDDDKKEKEDK